MRKHFWWIGSGTVCAGLVLGAAGQRGWGQPGELPGLRPNSLPAGVDAVPLKPPPPVTTLPNPSPPQDFKLPAPTASGVDKKSASPKGALPQSPSLPAQVEFKLPQHDCGGKEVLGQTIPAIPAGLTAEQLGHA